LWLSPPHAADVMPDTIFQGVQFAMLMLVAL
jgi:hypothetical protein